VTRVLNVVGSLQIGGAETYITRVAPLLRARGIDIEVCALERQGPLLACLEAAGIEVHGTIYARRLERSNTLTLIQTIGQLRDLIRRRRYDVVHSYLFWADVLTAPAALLAGRSRRIVSRRALHPWRHDPSRFHHSLELGSNLCANELIANSEAVMRDVERNERFLPRTRTVIYNGIDPLAYQPARISGSGRLRVVTVGTLAHRKGQVSVLRAMGLLRAQGVEAELTLVGDGPDRALLEREAAAVQADVVFAGEHRDPRPFLARSDVFVLPSAGEGFSNALLEAMASALPVVATDVGGNAEALGDGKGGRMVAPGDPEAIAAALAELAADRAQLAEMGRANRQRVERVFTLEASAARLADWYRRPPAS
jgi:glycosyltransferase involved in cell wall biosynthesis